MTPLASKTKYTRGRRAAAFSLAEMMIALVILGFGLLVVGAALPVGYRYTQDTINKATGDAAAEYVLDVIEQNIRLCANPLDSTGNLRYRTDIFRPRDVEAPLPPQRGAVLPDYEPLIKVRPLLPISVNPADFDEELEPYDEDAPCRGIEEIIARWMLLQGITGAGDEYVEYDRVPPALDNWTASSLPSVSAVYPPVTPRGAFAVSHFLPDLGGDPYAYYRVSDVERRKAADRQITWAAFYRRLSYAPGSDPNLYEVIAVIVRRPSASHRFRPPSPDVAPTPGSPASATASADRAPDRDTLAPVPRLLVFHHSPGSGRPLPTIENLGGTSADILMPDMERVLRSSFAAPPTLTFHCGPNDGRLLPPGSIFIPAVNDDRPNALQADPPPPTDTPVRRAGFVPHAPNALPIYEVIERSYDEGSDTYALTVKNNGFYPWVANGLDGGAWPVWVIPPAFSEVDSTGNPLYEGSSPILAWARRVIRFTEVP